VETAVRVWPLAATDPNALLCRQRRGGGSPWFCQDWRWAPLLRNVAVWAQYSKMKAEAIDKMGQKPPVTLVLNN